MKVHDNGILKAGGVCIDEVEVIGETAYSEELLWSVVHSWADLVHKYFLDKEYDRSSLGLGDAFRRLLCANRVQKRIEDEGHLS